MRKLNSIIDYALKFLLIGCFLFNIAEKIFADPPEIVINAKNITNDQVSETNGEPLIDFGIIANDGHKHYHLPYQYIQISYQHIDPYNFGWGIQIYTDNADYQGAGLRGGLISTTGLNCIPLFWRIYNTNQSTNVNMTNEQNWGMIKDKNDNNWTNYSPFISIVYSNQLAPFPDDVDRTLPDDSITNADIYLYLGLYIDENAGYTLSGLGYYTTLNFDIYYLVPMPAIHTISPDYGYQDSIVDVYIEGWNFIQGPPSATVCLRKNGEDDIIGKNIIISNENKIYCSFDLTDAASGFWDVVVINPEEGYEGTLTKGFEVRSLAPVITSISPEKGNNNTILRDVIIKGNSFSKGAEVLLQKAGESDLSAFDINVCSKTKITCSLDLSKIRQTGKWDLKIINPDKREVISKEIFHVMGYDMTGDMFIPVNNIFNPKQGEKVYLKWAMTKKTAVTIRIYNIKGKLVKTFLDNITYQPGNYQLEWMGVNDHNQKLASGLYIVKITVGGFTQTSKIVLVK